MLKQATVGVEVAYLFKLVKPKIREFVEAIDTLGFVVVDNS